MLFYSKSIIPPNVPEFYEILLNKTSIQSEYLKYRNIWAEFSNFTLLLALLYVPCVFSLQKFMKKRKAFDLKTPLIIWNIIAALFSTIGAYYIIPILIESMKLNFTDSVCNPMCYINNKEANWIVLFNFSKVFEWIDTIFILLRKRKLLFIHWIHHIITMLFCWNGNQYSMIIDCSGWWFASMNFFVHAIMYSYYALRALNIKIPFSNLITLLQTVQMFIGTYIVLYSIRICQYTFKWNKFGSLFGLFMYGFYIYLFTKLLFNRIKRKRD